MAKPQKKTSSNTIKKVTNTDKLHKRLRSMNNVGAKHVVGSNCYKLDLLCHNFQATQDLMRQAAKMITK